MSYPVCPSCGAYMSNIIGPYEQDLKKLCEEFEIDHELMSKGIVNNEKFNKAKKELVDKYTDPERYCCRMRLTNSINLANLIK
jgi:hypothetical protein